MNGGYGAQPVVLQASQQLGWLLTHALPFFGALHAAARLMLHLVGPLAPVRQQATNPALPQVDRAAHFFTACLQVLGRPCALATCTAQRT